MFKLKFLLPIALFFALIGCKSDEPKGRIPKAYSIEQLFDNQSISGADFNGDETKILVSNNKSGIFNVYELNTVDTSMKALTGSGKESFFAVGYLPNSTDIIYSADQGGNENDHLYLLKQGAAASQDLTNWANSSNSFFSWSADKKALYISSNKRNPKYFDLVKMDIGKWSPILLYQNDAGLSPAAVSKSERFIALEKSITNYLYPDEGHGFIKKENQITTSRRTLEFLDKHLKPQLLK